MTPWCAHRPLIVVSLQEILKALDFSPVILIPSKILFGSCQASRGLDFCAQGTLHPQQQLLTTLQPSCLSRTADVSLVAAHD